MKEERIYIIGYMASGKTTFGRALAARIGWDFLDLDAEIERQAGRGIPAIISEDGEEGFRQIESRVLKQTAALPHAVVACGGGTPCWRDNMEFMTLHGVTLWLVASPDRIAERIVEAGDTRPLLSGVEEANLPAFIRSHLLQRQPYYCRAMLRHSGENLETEEEIAACVSEFLDSKGASIHQKSGQ